MAGGLLTELGWRWTFLLPVPIALALLALGPRYLPRDRVALSGRRAFDIPGAVTLTAGCCCSCARSSRRHQGWGAPATLAAFAVAAMLLAAFVMIERRRPRRWSGSASCGPARSYARTSA